MDIADIIGELAHPYPSGGGVVEYFLVRVAPKEYKLLLFLPYSPFTKNPEGYTNLDAYYVASNTLYHTQKAIIAKLASFGAQSDYNDIKSEFERLGCGVRLHTTLIAIPPYGTKVALAIVSLKGEFLEHKVAFSATCDNCGRCVAACPSGGISATNFTRALCLRDAMDNYQHTKLNLAPLSGSILGCDRCQSVCPQNSAIASTETPAKLLEMLSFKWLSHAFKSGKKGLMPLAEFMGANYIRPNRIAFFAINSVTQQCDSYFLQQFFDNADPTIANAAKAQYLSLNKDNNLQN
ncbi:MAG: 4Fe-4S double cluster binding domain-containing protein [Bacillota bacterium]